jgi:hypothetical protein
MKGKLVAQRRNQTWDLVPRANRRKMAPQKWENKVKSRAEGQTGRYKTRSVTRGPRRKKVRRDVCSTRSARQISNSNKLVLRGSVKNSNTNLRRFNPNISHNMENSRINMKIHAHDKISKGSRYFYQNI